MADTPDCVLSNVCPSHDYLGHLKEYNHNSIGAQRMDADSTLKVALTMQDQIAAFRSELEQVKKERDEWQRAADENVRTLGGVVERANARTERAIEGLRQIVVATQPPRGGCATREHQIASDLLRELDAEEKAT